MAGGMTVGELIAHLDNFHDKTPVLIGQHGFGVVQVTHVAHKEMIKLDDGSWDDPDGEGERSSAVMAVAIE